MLLGMKTNRNIPPIRVLDVQQVEQDGETLFLLRDPSNVVDAAILLSPAAMYISTLLDGRHGIADIQSEYHRETDGQTIGAAEVQELVDYLDEQGFLLSPRFARMQEAMRAAFHASDTRPAAMAGRSYPDDPGELRTYLDGLFTREGGPGALPGQAQPSEAPLCALIAPHIDFERGGHSYAHGYLRLAQSPPPKTVFIFGVAHDTPPVPYILTKKDFDTPLGVMETDGALVERLAAACSWDPFAYELVHRTEHSIEFQALLLAHVLGDSVRIVPVLCGAFLQDDPSGPPTAPEAFLHACREIIEEQDGAACVIAGADLAHVGPCFGDDFEIDETAINAVAARDREDLGHVFGLDAAGWYQSVMKDSNERRVCGVNAIYSTLKCIEGHAQQAQLHHYGYAPDPAGGLVSFADITIS